MIFSRTSVPTSDAVQHRLDIKGVAEAMNRVGYSMTDPTGTLSPRVDLDDMPDLARDIMMQMAEVAMEMTRKIDAMRKK